MKSINDARLCINCAFAETKSDSKAMRYAHCLHPKALVLAEFLVNGDMEDPDNYRYAATMRMMACGADGRLWQQRSEQCARASLPEPVSWWDKVWARRHRDAPVDA